MSHDSASPNPTPVDDRRRASRLPVIGEIHGQVVGLDHPVVVREMSTDGFSVQSTIAFPIGSSQDFRLNGRQQVVVRVTARAVHGLRVSVPGGEFIYITGFQFDAEDLGTRDTIARLIAQLSEVSFGV